jgi:hypothetical protein
MGVSAKRVAGYPGSSMRFALGTTAMAAYLLPLLGAGASTLIYLHPRIVSFLLIGLAGLLSREMVPPRYGPRRTALAPMVLVLALLLALAALYLPPGHPIWVWSNPVDINAYPGYKFTAFVFTTIPLVALVVFVTPFTRDRRFIDGLIFGTFLCWMLAAVTLWQAGSLVASYDLGEAGFGEVSLSIVVMFGAVGSTAMFVRRPNRWRLLGMALVSVTSVVMILLIGQRGAFVVAAIVPIVAILARPRGYRLSRLASLGLTLAVFVAVPLVVLAVMTTAANAANDFSKQTTRFESALSGNDLSINSRVDMWSFAAAGTISNPLGHGLGDFANHYPVQRFPHIVLLELPYELGFLGGFIGLLLCVVSGRLVLQGIGNAEASLYWLGLLSICLIVVKASALETIGLWVWWVLMGTAALAAPRRPRGVHQT